MQEGIGVKSESEKTNGTKKQPRERIELLLSTPPGERDRRVYNRSEVEPGTTVYFPMVCKGEVMDISDKGMSIRVQPLDSPTLAEENTLSINMPLDTHSFKMKTTIKRIESRFGVIVLGLYFDPEEVEVDD